MNYRIFHLLKPQQQVVREEKKTLKLQHLNLQQIGQKKNGRCADEKEPKLQFVQFVQFVLLAY